MTDTSVANAPITEADIEQAQKLLDELVNDLTKDTSQPFFDIVLIFRKDKGLELELFVDENVKLVIEGLLTSNDSVVLKTNWFARGMKIHTLTNQELAQSVDASVRPPEARTATIGSKPSKHTRGSKIKA